MKYYTPNETANVTVVIPVRPANSECNAYLFLASGRDMANAVAIASQRFISTGTEQILTFTLKVPRRGGIWHSYFEMYSLEGRLLGYWQHEDILVTEAEVPEGYQPPAPLGDMCDLDAFFVSPYSGNLVGGYKYYWLQAYVNIPGSTYDPDAGWVGGTPVTVATWICSIWDPPHEIWMARMLAEAGVMWHGYANRNYGFISELSSPVSFLEPNNEYWFWLQDDLGRISFARKVIT